MQDAINSGAVDKVRNGSVQVMNDKVQVSFAKTLIK
jgi:hypothetical protein